MRVVKVGSNKISILLKEDHKSKYIKRFTDKTETIEFEVSYNSFDQPIAIHLICSCNCYQEDYLSSISIEEIVFGGKEIYAVPFIQDVNLLHCEKISICNKGDLYVCFNDEKVYGLIIPNKDLFNLENLLECSYLTI